MAGKPQICEVLEIDEVQLVNMNLLPVLKPLSRLLFIGIVAFNDCYVIRAAVAKPSLPESSKRNDAFRKSNKNYSNACALLSKKRMAKTKMRKSKQSASKWR